MEPRKLIVPDPSLVVLVGASGCGKSTFARRHFRSTEVLSSDFFRALVCDDEADQSSSRDAFELLHQVIARRLARRRLTVVDATSVLPEGRRQLLDLASHYHTLAVALVFDLGIDVCLAHNQQRPGRVVPAAVIQGQLEQLRRALDVLPKEDFCDVFVLRSPEEVETAIVERRPLWCDRRGDHGPFDIIGDVHGCFDELLALLGQLGYRVENAGQPGMKIQPPPGRKAIFVGDLVDRGPKVPDVLRLVMGMVEAGTARCVVGNHDDKLLRYLLGRKVKVGHGLAETLRQLEPEPDEFKQHVIRFLDELLSHYVLDDGKLVVAHAGLREDLQGRASRRVRDFALYGDITGEMDERGLPVRLDWAANYRGAAEVVYGHTPVAEPQWVNRTLNIDTGCVFGGRLTALRYPEKELVSVPALRQYWEPPRPFLPEPARPDDKSGSC